MGYGMGGFGGTGVLVARLVIIGIGVMAVPSPESVSRQNNTPFDWKYAILSKGVHNELRNHSRNRMTTSYFAISPASSKMMPCSGDHLSKMTTMVGGMADGPHKWEMYKL